MISGGRRATRDKIAIDDIDEPGIVIQCQTTGTPADEAQGIALHIRNGDLGDRRMRREVQRLDGVAVCS